MTMDEWNNKMQAAQTAEEEDIKIISSEPPAEDKSGVPSRASKDESAGYIGFALGILSIIFGIFFGGAPWMGIILGVGAIIFSGMEKNKCNPNTKVLSIGGIACGIVGIVVSVFVGIACAVLGVAFKILLGIFKFLKG